jgi:hypothetical protein
MPCLRTPISITKTVIKIQLLPPKRHDLTNTSCVNSAVITYNRKLYKKMKTYEYVKIIESDMHREHFATHGLHMNTVGKELMAQRITDHIRQIFLKRQTSPMILKWKQDLTKSSQEGGGVEGKVMCSRTSGRKRKQPTTRDNDFLWTANLITIE